MLRHEIFPVAAVVVALWAALPAANPALAIWTHKTRLSTTPESEEYPRIAAVGCFVHVIWIDLDNRDLHYTRSVDAGASWSAPRILANSPPGFPIIQAEIAATGRRVEVVWQQGSYNQASIHHTRSLDRGSSWRIPQVLSTPGKSSEQPTLTVAGRSTYVAWIETRRGSDTKPVKLFLTRSQNRGKDWAAPARLDRRSKGLTTPRLATGGGRLHAFWGRRVNSDGAWTLEILNRASSDGGATWSPRTRAVADGWRPSSVAVVGDTVHLLWEDVQYKLAHIHYQRSDNAGQTWSKHQELDRASFASLGVSGERLEAAWIRDWDGTGSLFYSRSRDGGRTWPIRRQIARAGRFPALTVAGGRGRCAGAAHLAFGRNWAQDGQPRQEIFSKRSPKILP
jgi:hypothetical protein